MESPFQRTTREIDEDLWPEILKRLPPESVFRFQCVCRRWNSIISSPFFIHLYFTFNLSATPANLKPYFQINKDEQFPRALPLYTDNEQQTFHVPFQAVVEEGIDYKHCKFVDIIHGVVCLVYTLFPSVDDNNYLFPLATYLWNPSVHKYLALPRHIASRVGFGYGIVSRVGFGYDASRDDFKVVMISSSSRGDSNSLLSFDVCSTRQGFWRPQETGVDKIDGWISSPSCFVNGTIHWLITGEAEDDDDDYVYSVLMFDCESEKARTIDLSEQFGSSEVDLFEYAGMLAILVDLQRTKPCMNLWVMEEHGVSTSLKKLYTVNPIYPGGDFLGDFWRDPTIPCEIIMNDPSFEIDRRISYGPSNRWNERGRILDNHVYNKSMFLMDYPKAQSYTNQDVLV